MVTYIVTFGITQSLGLGTKCFIEGTLVLTSIGLVIIEDIKPNDEVWSYNEETKEKELKKVKQVFRNKTKEWLHLKVLNEETQKEENKTCTKYHRIYVKNKGWIEAINILENDIVLMYNNIQGRVINKELQILDHFETTYNFEVEDNHNYYVSEECILVHNECHHIISNKGKKGDEIAEIARMKYGTVNLNDSRNIVNILSHKGRHTNAYHKMVKDAVEDIIVRVDDLDGFYNEYDGCLRKGGANDIKDILKIFK